MLPPNYEPLFPQLRTLRKRMKSWKTTLGGILAGAALPMRAILPPDWAWISDAMLSFGALLTGLAARDNNVSSAKAGVR
jgi:hypothetical protein